MKYFKRSRPTSAPVQTTAVKRMATFFEVPVTIRVFAGEQLLVTRHALIDYRDNGHPVDPNDLSWDFDDLPDCTVTHVELNGVPHPLYSPTKVRVGDTFTFGLSA